MARRRPIFSDEITDAFGEAVLFLVQWRGGKDEPVVTLDARPWSITAIFGVVLHEAIREELPASMLDLLKAYASQVPERRPEYLQLALIPTYEIAARCLLKWVRDKKSKRPAE
jgi:hypothetical protein